MASSHRFYRILTVLLWAVFATGLFFPEHRLWFWVTALAVGLVRSIFGAVVTEGKARLVHAGIGFVFALGVVSIALQALGQLVIPWWYAAYALVGVLFFAILVWRIGHARKRAAPEASEEEE